MNIDNTVLVRAMNHLPLNGEIVPSCEGKYLKPDGSSDFAFVMRDIVKKELEKELGRPLNLYYESEDEKLLNAAMQDMYPYTSDYTSTLSFSLNGLVPDDINNKFSDMKIAVLEPLKNHTDAEFLSVDVIDTTIKGRINASGAILLIDSLLFESLDADAKNNLLSNYQVEVFTGSLKEAVKESLVKHGYPALEYNQRREDNYIVDCVEKESMIEFQDTFAESVKASRLRLAQLYMEPFLHGVDLEAGEKAKADFYKGVEVANYYKNKLYEFLVAKGEEVGIVLSDEEKFYLFSEYSNSKEVLSKLTESLIQAYGGVQSFKMVIQEYNQELVNNYLTSEEIIENMGDTRK